MCKIKKAQTALIRFQLSGANRLDDSNLKPCHCARTAEEGAIQIWTLSIFLGKKRNCLSYWGVVKRPNT